MSTSAPHIDWPTVSAFFVDVDETLINDKSMRSFLHFAGRPVLDLDPDHAWSLVTRHGNGPGGREAANESYYSMFAGCQIRTLEETGAAWFAGVNSPHYWVEPIVALCEQAHAAGVPVVLVSGSHRACLEPIAKHVRADTILCTELEVAMNGELTGERLRSAIGASKLERIAAWAQARRIDLSHSVGAGDHVSDADFLRACGLAVTLAISRDLADQLSASGYRQIGTGAGWDLWRDERTMGRRTPELLDADIDVPHGRPGRANP